MNKILIVVDMQNDFIDGSLGSVQAQAIVPKVVEKIEKYQEDNIQIVCTLDTHNDDYLNTPEGKSLPIEHCIKNTNGWNIHPDILSIVKDKRIEYIEKNTFGFGGWNTIPIGICMALIIDEIELCGLCTDICVITNALILKTMYPDIKITVDASCCAGVTEESHQAALLTMKMCQINVVNK